jgi:hypothetical protein
MPASVTNPERRSLARISLAAPPRRAFEAAICGMFLVDVDAIRHAYFSAGVKYSDDIPLAEATRDNSPQCIFASLHRAEERRLAHIHTQLRNRCPPLS